MNNVGEQRNRLRLRSKTWFAGLMVGLLIGGMAAASSGAFSKKDPGATGPVADVGKDAVMHYRMDTDAFGGNHTTWIEVSSFSWGITQSGTSGGSGGGGGGAGKATFSSFTITKHLDRFSPEIALDVATGKHLKDLTVVGAASDAKNETTYFKVKLQDILVSSYQTSGSAGGSDLPMESVSFDYAKITFMYVGPDPTMSSEMSCDLAKGTC